MGKSHKAKQGISKVKKKNIHRNKLSKQGIIGKENRKQRRKERRKENRKVYYAQLQEKQKREAEREPEYELTGEDMMEMIDDEDMETLLQSNTQSKKKEEPKTEIKKLLPIRTEKGWEDREVEVVKEEKELQLTEYKREKKKKGKANKDAEEEDEDDSGIAEDEQQESSSEEEEDEGPPPVERSVSEILGERRRKLHTKKVKMACLASNLIENPTKTTNLWVLLDMLTGCDAQTEVTIKKYCCLTILQVFHNLIPAYRIQEKTLTQKMKKETLQVAKQEMDLINQYRKYLQILEDCLEALKGNSKNLALLCMGRTAVQCFGELLVKHPKFNYSVNVIQALVPYLNHSDKELRTIVYSSLSQTIRNDKSCYMTLEIVRKIYKLIHRLKFKVKSEAIEVFLSVRVHEMKNVDTETIREKRNNTQLSHKERLIKKLSDQAKLKPSKKQKKEKKKMAKLREQMAEINAVEIQNVKNVRHSEILQTIFGIFIHILKRKPNSQLMGVVLKGLAKYAHLINMEFFSDLLSLMNKFLEDGILTKKESLHCIQTVFTILSGQGESLNIDPNRFYKAFYAMLLEMNTETVCENIEVILEIIKQMLLCRKKKVSSAKVLSFTKRLATLCPTLPHNVLIPTLVTLKSLFSTFSCTEALLDPDPEGSPGMFLPEVPDPEHANSSSTALWDMHHCLSHYHPSVRLLSANILSNISARELVTVSSLTRRSTEELLSDFDWSRLKFKPSLPHPDIHLQNLNKKRKMSNKWGNCELTYDFETKRLKLTS